MRRPTARRTGPASSPWIAPGDDDFLVERARLGAPDAYDELFRRHRERVARVAYLLLRDPDLAQDTAQEAFLIGWRDLQRLREPAAFHAWVTGIAVNLCRRRWRQRASALRRHLSEARDPAGPTEADAADLRVAVRGAVEVLPRVMREVVVLRFYGGFAEAEIAAALGIPQGTVKSRLNRARARLAEALRGLVEVDE